MLLQYVRHIFGTEDTSVKAARHVEVASASAASFRSTAQGGGSRAQVNYCDAGAHGSASSGYHPMSVVPAWLCREPGTIGDSHQAS